MNKIKKVLIANRGEIALRIIRACKELDITSVAIFSEVDVEGIWVRKADECYPIMGDVIKAYLDYEKIITIAKRANCDAIHPGYGFLSENADFARACEANGIIFIGPKPDHIELFGVFSDVLADAPIDRVYRGQNISIGVFGGFLPVVVDVIEAHRCHGQPIVGEPDSTSVWYILGSFLLLNLFSARHRHFDSPIESDRKCAGLARSSSAHDVETSRTIKSGLAFLVHARPQFILDRLDIEHGIPIPFRIACVVTRCKPREFVKATIIGRYTISRIVDEGSGKAASGHSAPGTLKDEI